MRRGKGTGSVDSNGMPYISVKIHAPKLTSSDLIQICVQRSSNFAFVVWRVNSEMEIYFTGI